MSNILEKFYYRNIEQKKYNRTKIRNQEQVRCTATSQRTVNTKIKQERMNKTVVAAAQSKITELQTSHYLTGQKKQLTAKQSLTDTDFYV